jgi:hypothetical protein
VIYNPNVEAKQIFRKRILKKDEIQNEKAVGVKKVEDPCYNQNLSLRSPGYYLQK